LGRLAGPADIGRRLAIVHRSDHVGLACRRRRAARQEAASDSGEEGSALRYSIT
jgi:hypothetical protein